MPAIAGIAASDRQAEVEDMLAAMAHRGHERKEIFTVGSFTLGAAWQNAHHPAVALTRDAVRDVACAYRCAEAALCGSRLILRRDPLGVAPLYYGRTAEGALAFASEVKGLLQVTAEVFEFPPGGEGDGERFEVRSYQTGALLSDETPATMAAALRQRLASAVTSACAEGANSAWLSGGLDSSIIAALARPHVARFHTFAGGLRGAADLRHARAMAEHLRAAHHEIIVSADDLRRALPDVIYHLESFDALLVRSSVVNYLVARETAQYSAAVLSGEGSDELFAGYEYLQNIPQTALAAELVSLCHCLHNTALQRVDRCAAAHGLVAHVPFLNPEVLTYAWHIPVDLKLRGGMGKWILRQAMADLLPPAVRNRRKAKFWEGSGVGGLLAEYADAAISDADFSRERHLANGWHLSSKEELLYYRIFRERLGDPGNLHWMGRTKESAPEVEKNAIP